MFLSNIKLLLKLVATFKSQVKNLERGLRNNGLAAKLQFQHTPC